MKTAPVSRAEVVAIVTALLMLALQALPAAPAGLEYRYAALPGQPWRLITGHLVHVNWQHALINAVALWVVARLFAPDLRALSQFAALLTAALVISVGLAWLYPSIVWYRGLSGVLHALFFAGATKWLIQAKPRHFRQLWLPSVLLAGGWIKVVLEQPGGATTPYAEWLGSGTVPQAHLIGAACGTVLGLVFALSEANSRRKE